MSEEEQKYFKDLIGFTFDSDDIKYIENIVKRKDKVINDLLKRISDLEFEVEKQDKEIERLKEEYMILQNASDEVEEEKDKEIERLNNIINELEKELDRGYRDLFEHELVPGRELITNIKNYLQELKGSDKE